MSDKCLPVNCPKCNSKNIDAFTRGEDVGETVGMAAAGVAGATGTAAATGILVSGIAAPTIATPAIGAGTGAVAAAAASENIPIPPKWRMGLAVVSAVATGVLAFMHFSHRGRDIGKKFGKALDEGILRKYICKDCGHVFK